MKKQKLLSMILGLLLAVLCLPQTALAYTWITDLDTKCSLTITSQHGGVTYDAYKVCDVDTYISFAPCGVFAEDSISGSIKLLVEAGNWQSLTDTLDNWLVTHAIQPYQTIVTDNTGYGRFERLPAGLYLVRGREYLTDAGYYIPKSFVICLPDWVEPGDPGNVDGTEAKWVYEVTAKPKGSIPDNKLTARSVLKIWQGVGSEARPTAVTVQLLRTDRQTGETVVWRTVTLNGRNGWSTLWPDLDNVNYTWTVQEVDVPGEYDVGYHQMGINVVITNYYTPDKPGNDPDPPPPEDTPEDPPEDPPNNPGDLPPGGPPPIPGIEIDEPPVPLSPPPEEDVEIDEPPPEELVEIDDPPVPLARLPQTGMLWWPVPFLAVGGMFLFVLGWALNRRDRYDEK